MSNGVQLSLKIEKVVARRTFPLQSRNSACRRLFGPVDHAELSREMDAKLRENLDRDRRRWNFNFESDAPAESGEYEWEASPAKESPAFYQDSTQNSQSKCPATPAKVPLEIGQLVVEDLPAHAVKNI